MYRRQRLRCDAMLMATFERWLRLRPVRSEAGQAMLIVIAALALMATIPLVVITTTANQLPLTAKNLNWNAAYEAAQAGVNDYVQNLDANESYAEYNKSNQPSPSNPAFAGWEQVGGTTNPPQWFEYTPNVANGSVSLKVSGKAGNGPGAVIRNFTYTLIPQSTLDYIYWTNYEKIDPNLPNPPGPPNGVSGNNCAYYQGQSAEIPACQIDFGSADVINGPVFSNDAFYMCGNPTFNSTVQSGDSYKTSPFWTNGSGCSGSAPNFQDGTPTSASNQPIPSTGAAQAPAQQLGCYINNSSGTTTFTLGPSSNSATLTWSGGTLANASGNPNTAAACGGSSGGGTVTFATLKSALFYVNGNINVSGNVSGFLTLVASGNINITGSILYPSADITSSDADPTDALGLVTQNFINVTPTGSTTIDAAMLAASGSFYANDYNSHSCGGGVSACPTLTIFGALAQDYRGPVGQLGSSAMGFQKNYIYDESLQTLWPPFFLPPSGATWNPTSYDEIQPGTSNEAVPGT